MATSSRFISSASRNGRLLRDKAARTLDFLLLKSRCGEEPASEIKFCSTLCCLSSPYLRLHFLCRRGDIVTSEQLLLLFECFGEVTSCSINSIKMDTKSDSAIGCAVITFKEAKVGYVAASAMRCTVIASVTYLCSMEFEKFPCEHLNCNVFDDNVLDTQPEYISPCITRFETDYDSDDEEYPLSLQI